MTPAEKLLNTLAATLESALIGQATKADVIAACDAELNGSRPTAGRKETEMQIINKHSLTVLEVTSRERGEEFKGAEWVELQSYVSALRAERDELREALQTALHRADQALHFTAETIEPITAEWLDGIISNARAVLAKYEKE